MRRALRYARWESLDQWRLLRANPLFPVNGKEWRKGKVISPREIATCVLAMSSMQAGIVRCR